MRRRRRKIDGGVREMVRLVGDQTFAVGRELSLDTGGNLGSLSSRACVSVGVHAIS